MGLLCMANPTIALSSRAVASKGTTVGSQRPRLAGLRAKQSLSGVAIAPCKGLTPLRNRKTVSTRAAVQTSPEKPEAEANEAHQWQRVTDAGVKKAHELWQAARNMAPRGEWAGRYPLQKVWGSDVMYSAKRPKFLGREWKKEDIVYGSFIAAMHAVACYAPFCFSWANLNMMLVGWVITGMFGITLSYHRQLAHKSFNTPKWLEYLFAYCGALAVQGDPIEWVSSHRYHHLHTDTPHDPHTPYEGFWWSHCGWFLDNSATESRVGNRSNASDLQEQPFYQFLQKTYGWHIVASGVATYLLGGWEAFVWAFALRVCWVHHITWFVNSACHVWGNQQYNTGDLSRNNWWVGILAFGEGWHNNHHAFEFSCRHGLEWYQYDPTYYTIKFLEMVGLADKLKYPSDKKRQALAI